MSEQTNAGPWFYGQQGAQQGPIDLEALRGMAASGRLQPGDLVWREGMPDWVPAGSVPEVFGGISPTAAAPMNPSMNAPMPTDYAGGYAAGPVPSYAPGGPVPVGYYTPTMGGVVYAGFWWRVLAVIIDGILLRIVLYPIELLLGTVVPEPQLTTPAGGGPAAIDLTALLVYTAVSFVAQVIIYAAYYGFMESSRHQASVGKIVCGLKVTDVNGQRISLGRAVGRYLASLLSLLIVGIGYLMGAFTEKKQCLHDMIAGTLVVKGRPQG